MWWIILCIVVAFVVYALYSAKIELDKAGGFENYKNSKREDENLRLLKNLQRDQHAVSLSDRASPIQRYSNKSYVLEYSGGYDFDQYPFEIVGEASYQNNIKKFAVMREGRGCWTELKATINREPNNSYDKNACRVDINGLTVGYFARNDAVSWVRLLKKLNIADSSIVRVDAVIVGGGTADYSFGVRLNMPSRIGNAAQFIYEVL